MIQPSSRSKIAQLWTTGAASWTQTFIFCTTFWSGTLFPFSFCSCWACISDLSQCWHGRCNVNFCNSPVLHPFCHVLNKSFLYLDHDILSWYTQFLSIYIIAYHTFWPLHKSEVHLSNCNSLLLKKKFDFLDQKLTNFYNCDWLCGLARHTQEKLT